MGQEPTFGQRRISEEACKETNSFVQSDFERMLAIKGSAALNDIYLNERRV